MRTVTSFPYDVREEENIWIPMADGVLLAARLWRPAFSETYPVPAILEIIPYRRRDLTALRDSIHHPYLAGHGYACVRVDLRGSGESEGVLTDEYLDDELTDAEGVLAWLRRQPWCTGRCGMMGISWGGFNALQVAARNPPGLAAVVTASSTDDRYADDVHYMGGCLLADNLSWASTMFAYNSCPPDPAVVGERWRSMWHARLARSGLWLEEWLLHQHRDDYWRHGSVCEDYAAVRCPVFAVSGWADGYSNSVFRLLANLEVPCKGLIGPWGHMYPHLGRPGQAIGFLQELVGWWDHWLKGVDNDAMDGPKLRVWMQESVPPQTSYERRPGRWIGEPGWPSPNVHTVEHPLPDGTPRAISSPLFVGRYGGKWCSYQVPPDLPGDQRTEDSGSLVFEFAPSNQRYEILGAPTVELELAADQPVAMLAVRLSDIAEDGAATRVSYGLLNLTHRGGHAAPEPLVPGNRYRITLALNDVAQVVPAGHLLRLAISTSYWPLAWPPPQPVRLWVFTGASRLLLPIRPPRQTEEAGLQPFAEPEGAEPIAIVQQRKGEQRWTVSDDLVHAESELEVVKDLGTVYFADIDLEVTRRAEERYTASGDDVCSVTGKTTWLMEFERDNWKISTQTRTTLTCTPTHFALHAELDAFEDDRRVVSYNWDRLVPRNLV